MPPIISIVGKSGSGKTTLIEKLIPELKRRNYKVCIIKHAFHAFDIDKEGKDSWRHKRAGADTVIVASKGKVSMVKDHDSESIDSLALFFSDADIVITEGYKSEHKPKIEVFRPEAHENLLCTLDDNLIAVVSNVEIDAGVPRFGLEDSQGLANFIKKFLFPD